MSRGQIVAHDGGEPLVERGDGHAAGRVEGEFRRGEVPELVQPLGQPAEEEAEQRPADPRAHEEAGPRGEDGEWREVHEDQRGRPPAQPRQEAEDQEGPAAPGVRDEDRVGGEQAEIAEEEVRHVVGGHEAPLREEQGRHGEDREPEEGRRADPGTAAGGATSSRGSGDRCRRSRGRARRSSVPATANQGARGYQGAAPKYSGPAVIGSAPARSRRAGMAGMRLVPVERPVERRDESERADAGADEEQERRERQECRPAGPRGDRIGPPRRHSPRRRGSGISSGGLHAARTLAAGLPPSVCCGSGRVSGMTGRWPGTP